MTVTPAEVPGPRTGAGGAGGGAVGIRAAGPGDREAVLGLAAAVPGAGAGPEALRGALDGGLVSVAVVGGEVVGYAVVERPLAHHVRLTALAVALAHRRRGVGSALLGRVLAEARAAEGEGGSVSAVAGPAETAVAGLLLAHGFLGTRVLRGGADGQLLRVHYQHTARATYVDPYARHLVPAADVPQLVASLAAGDQALTALTVLSGEPAFEVTRFEPEDPSSLRSDETQVGLGFAGAVLASLTFLVGFSFASSHYPSDVRLLLIVATFVSTMSLIIYASAGGELARVRSNSFGRIMKWGNVLSEYGGVLPFLASLPITFAQLDGSTGLAVATGALFSVGLGAYEWSPFSIAHRFRWTATTVVLTGLTSLAPTGCVAMTAAGEPSWPCTAVLMAALAARTWVYLARRGAEAAAPDDQRGWQIRQ